MEPAGDARKRRRWPVVVLLIVLVIGGGAAWRSWPRIDPRIIGKWMIAGEGVWGWRQQMEFKANGEVDSFQYRSSPGEIRQHNLYSWSVRAGRLVLAPPAPSLQAFDQWVDYSIGRLMGDAVRTYEIVTVDSSTMCLRDTGSGIESEYIR